MVAEYSEDIYPYATFQLEESVPPGGDSRCNSAAPLQTFVYHDPRLSTADTLQLREVSSNVQFAFVIHHRFLPFAIRVCSPNHGKIHLRTPHASSNSSTQFTTVCVIARDRSSYRCERVCLLKNSHLKHDESTNEHATHDRQLVVYSKGRSLLFLQFISLTLQL